MLLSLDIKNVALITHLRLDFDKGLNILSGETGAGKSIILDSLIFALGGKSDKGLIRRGENLMSVEAVFDIAKDKFMLSYLNGLGIEDDILIFCRTLNAEGKNNINVNGRTMTLSMLKDITPRLIDIYSQSEHVSLLKPSTHIDLLDGFAEAENAKVKESILSLYTEYKKVVAGIKKTGDNTEQDRLTELYKYQIEEIEQADLTEAEEEELIKKRNKQYNMEKITQNANEALSLFTGEAGLNSAVSSMKNILSHSSKYDEDLSVLSDRFDSVSIELDDIYCSLNDYIYNLDYDEREAERVEKRLEQIKNLKRKYGKTIEDVLNYLENIKTETAEIESNRENTKKQQELKSDLEKQLYSKSKILSDIRKQTAKKFENQVLSNLADLSMNGCSFKVSFEEFPKIEDTQKLISENGIDKVEFFISTNKGEPLKPLAKIISGGEMSRFMLAIKNIISDTDGIDTLIFDEIDSGISGVTATAVAKKFASIALKHQIIAITHLPQIASMADSSFLIQKKEEGNAVKSFITKLTDEGMTEEVSRLIGAAELGSHGKLHAKEMILWSQNYKKELKAI